VIAWTDQGRGTLGVVDGAWRKNLLRQIGYKL
jgi:adenosine/AMP kinase